MTRAEFTKSLHLGLGRAFLYARDHDVSEYRDVILDACLHCYSYDLDIEGTRADYMYDLVGLLPDRDFYHEAVLKSLAEAGDDWDAVQRFRFVTRMALDGNENAKRAMYANYKPGPRYGESIGISFVDTDGIPGLLFVAEKMGALLLADSDESDIGWMISRSKEAFGEQATWDALRAAAEKNPRIEAYRQAAEPSPEPSGNDSSRAETRSMSYAELLKNIPANMPYLLWQWGEHASDQELELAARGLVAAQDPNQQLWHLRIFKQRRFPLAPEALIALADVEEERVVFAAVEVLAHVKDRVVRDLAFRLMKSNVRWRGESVALLNKNFEPGDHEIVLSWFEAEEDDRVRHSLGSDLRTFWEQHPDEKTELRMLQSLYEKGPCFVCRERAVRRLIELDALTKEMRVECAYDANEEIRELVSGQRPSD